MPNRFSYAIFFAIPAMFKLAGSPPVITSQLCYKLFLSIWKRNTLDTHECLYAIYLNSKNEYVDHKLLTEGGYSNTIIDPRRLISHAFSKHSNNIVLAHNHTSGIARPSKKDIERTKELLSVMQYLEFNLVDHLIITKDDYYSFRDEGHLNSSAFAVYPLTGKV